MFTAYPRDAFMTSPSASLAPAGLGTLDHDPISRDLLQRSCVPVTSEAPARGAPEPVWNFIPMDHEGGAAAAETEDHDPELERYLVQEIARAKRRRPLMKRLARVEEAYAELPASLTGMTAPPAPPPLPSLEAVPQPSPTITLPIDQLMEEFGETYTAPPASAEWLGKAQRQRRRARLRTALAWIATLIIGAAIVSATMTALKG